MEPTKDNLFIFFYNHVTPCHHFCCNCPILSTYRGHSHPSSTSLASTLHCLGTTEAFEFPFTSIQGLCFLPLSI